MQSIMVKTTSSLKNKFPAYKDHLNKTFLEELNYKLWSTKGIRFKVSKRLLTQRDLSNKAIGFLSAYLIILGLISVYKITGVTNISNNLLAFTSTTLSILLLAFSQMENAKDFKIRANNYQQCALKISALYDELRIFKTLQNVTETEKINLSKELSTKYQYILENFPNHEDIDYKIFQADHDEYFVLDKWSVFKTKLRYYIHVKLIYHLMILLPPLIFITIIFL